MEHRHHLDDLQGPRMAACLRLLKKAPCPRAVLRFRLQGNTEICRKLLNSRVQEFSATVIFA